MKHIVEAGCDGATLCFFDPAALPSDFNTQVEEDPVGLMEQLQQQHTLWFGGTGGDGSYTFHVYVDEDAPVLLRKRATLVDSFDAFAIPSGRLCICGAEYAANDPLIGSSFTPTGGLEKYSNMGGIIELTAGNYCLEVLEIEWSDEDRESAQTTVISKNQLRCHRWLEALMALLFVFGSIGLAFSALMTVLLLLITLYNYFFQPHLLNRLPTVLEIWIPIALGSGLLFALGLLLSRRHSDSDVTQLLTTVSQEMPDYLLIAKRHTACK